MFWGSLDGVKQQTIKKWKLKKKYPALKAWAFSISLDCRRDCHLSCPTWSNSWWYYRTNVNKGVRSRHQRSAGGNRGGRQDRSIIEMWNGACNQLPPSMKKTSHPTHAVLPGLSHALDTRTKYPAIHSSKASRSAPSTPALPLTPPPFPSCDRLAVSGRQPPCKAGTKS